MREVGVGEEDGARVGWVVGWEAFKQKRSPGSTVIS